jgi:hypothetical protein
MGIGAAIVASDTVNSNADEHMMTLIELIVVGGYLMFIFGGLATLFAVLSAPQTVKHKTFMSWWIITLVLFLLGHVMGAILSKTSVGDGRGFGPEIIEDAANVILLLMAGISGLALGMWTVRTCTRDAANKRALKLSMIVLICAVLSIPVAIVVSVAGTA